MRKNEFTDRIDRYAKRLIFRVTVNTGRDQWKSDCFASLFLCQLQRSAITGDQQFPFSMGTAVPNRADGVDHVFARQAVGLCDFRISRLAATKRFAFRKQFRTRSPVNAAIHSTAAEQRE